MTTFASAATPIVRIRPAKPGQRHGDVEEQDRRVHEGRVDREAGHGDDTEQPVQEQEEDRDDDQPDQRRGLRLLKRVLPERRRHVRPLDLLERDGQGTGLEDEREILRVPRLADVLDLRAAGDAVRESPVRVVDLRPRLHLAVEDDREVLRDAAEAPPLPESARDVLEQVRPLAGERDPDDRLAELVEVLLRSRRLDVRAGHLRNGRCRVRVVLEEVVVRAALDEVRRTRVLLSRRARDDRGPGRHGENGAALGHARVRLGEQRVSRFGRAGDQPLLLVEEVVRGRAALLRVPLLADEEVVEARGRDRPARTDRTPGQVLLEVVELELCRLPDQRRRLLRIGDARELDHDLVRALLAELGLRHTELVDAAPHDADRPVEILGC